MALFRPNRADKKSKYAYKPVSASFQPEATFQPVTITYQLDPASKQARTIKAPPTRKPKRKNDDHATAFVVGLIVSGLASAAVVLWKTPRSGAKTRELIADRAEATLFQLMGMDDYLTGEKIPTAVQVTGSFGAAAQTESSSPASFRGEPRAASSPFDDTEPIASLDNDGGSLPPTYRGEVLTEVPTATPAASSPTAPSTLTTPGTPDEVETSPHGSNNR